MKKFIYILILIIPFLVLAEDKCDNSDITITSIGEAKTYNNALEIESPTFDKNNININIKFYTVDDAIEYNIKIKNNSNSDYEIDNKLLTTDDGYIKYDITPIDGDKIIKAKSEEDVVLTVLYNKQVEVERLSNGVFNGGGKLNIPVISTANKSGNSIIDGKSKDLKIEKIIEVVNPLTKDPIVIVVLLNVTILLIIVVMKSKRKFTKYFIFTSLLVLYSPFIVIAICKCELNIDSKIDIEDRTGSSYLERLVGDEDYDFATVIDKGSDEEDTCTYTFAYDGTEDNSLRYVGSNPCNYVKFNDELWRIIGVINNVDDGTGNKSKRIKIVRDEPIGAYSYHSSPSGVGREGLSQWGDSTYTNGDIFPGSSLMQELNGDYLDYTLTEDPMWIYSSSADLKEFDHTKVLKEDAQKMISNVLWYTGTANDTQISSYGSVSYLYTYDVYRDERSNNPHAVSANGLYYNGNDGINRTTTWIGKVALPYVSDKGFSMMGGGSKTRRQCIEESFQYCHNDCNNSTWLFPNDRNWTISPVADNNYNSRAFSLDARYARPAKAYQSENVSPSVYLNNSVKIISGEGSKTNPYIIIE